MSDPLVSIVTVAKNAEQVIRETLRSVAAQQYRDFEHVIIDGASQDRTLALVSDHRVSRMKVVSERDGGIAEAMNKGIRLSSGKLIIHLNAGDAFAGPDVLARVTADYDGAGWEWGIGSCEVVDARRRMISERRVRAFDFHCLRRVNFVPHQSTFVARAVFDRFGLFDETFKIAMDYDFWLRIGRSVRPRILPFVVARMRAGGASSNEIRNYWEYRRARMKNRPGLAAEGVLFEGEQFMLRVALTAADRLATVPAYNALKRSRVYRRARQAMLGTRYADLDAVFTTTVRKDG